MPTKATQKTAKKTAETRKTATSNAVTSKKGTVDSKKVTSKTTAPKTNPSKSVSKTETSKPTPVKTGLQPKNPEKKATPTSPQEKSTPPAKKPFLKPIVGRKPPQPQEIPDKKSNDKKKEVKKKPLAERKAEALSLIDEEEKAPKQKPKKNVLPPIIRAKTPGPVATEATATESVTEHPKAAESDVVENSRSEGTAETEKKLITLKPPFTVNDLAEAIGVKVFVLIGELMEMQIFAAKNHIIEPLDVAEKLCEKHGFIFERERREKGTGVHKPEVPVVDPPKPPKPPKDELELRAPIVTFMGHVDHGKTSLLDTIRKARVAPGEAGGITQHIGAYSVECKGSFITFLDTPGHEAFTKMRVRGTNVTDIVVLVVAADDGVKPTTLEAIAHAKAAKTADPEHFAIMVAINKVDLPTANPDKVKGQLQEHGLVVEDWGGDVIAVEVSAKKGTGIENLLESILLQSEMLELKASAKTLPRGIVIEAQVEAGRGPTATVIVEMGTLEVGQPFICGNYAGRVKALINDNGVSIKKAGPSTPVKVTGLSGLPNAGDEFLVMESDRAAKALSEERLNEQRQAKLARPQRATLESLMGLKNSNQMKKLSIILKTDVQGSLEALIHSLNEIKSDKVELSVIHSAVGPVTESDVLLATASDAIVIGFSVKVENTAVKASKKEGIQVKLYSIIYELIDQIKDAMAGLLDPEEREAVIGHAEVKQIFEVSKGIVAGCYVTDGRASRTARARVLRGRQAVYDGSVETLRRFQDEVKEVRSGVECGIKLGNYNEYEVGDVIEFYTLEKVPQKL